MAENNERSMDRTEGAGPDAMTRRQLFRLMPTACGGALAVTLVPELWSKPVVEASQGGSPASSRRPGSPRIALERAGDDAVRVSYRDPGRQVSEEATFLGLRVGPGGDLRFNTVAAWNQEPGISARRAGGSDAGFMEVRVTNASLQNAAMSLRLQVNVCDQFANGAIVAATCRPSNIVNASLAGRSPRR